jgi:benzil reductase ((S)-benzoin forming)
LSTDRVAIVTGAGSGLGRAVALALATPDLSVIGVGRRESALWDTAARAEGELRVVAADVADAAGRDRILAALRPREQVCYLVHAAGLHAIEPLPAIDPERWRQILATNVDARLFLSVQLLPRFGAGGRILFVGSNSATRARKSATAYCVSQAASFMLQECLKVELAERDVAVTSAVPSPVDTPMLAAQMSADPSIYPDAELYRRARDSGPLIAPQTVARFYRWLLTSVPADVYSAQAWDVKDTSHHPHWLGTDGLFKR